MEGLFAFKYKLVLEFFCRKFPHLRQEAEDFAQYCALRWLEGRHLQTSFIHLAVDYFRGPSLQGKSERRSDIMKRHLNLGDPEDVE